MSRPSSPMAISAIASWTLRIRSKLHSAPSNSGRSLALRLGSLACVTAASSRLSRCPMPRLSRRHVAGREQLVEHRVYVLRRGHPPHGEVAMAPGDVGVAMPHRRLVRVVEALAVGGLHVSEVLADWQHLLVEQAKATRHV